MLKDQKKQFILDVSSSLAYGMVRQTKISKAKSPKFLSSNEQMKLAFKRFALSLDR
jgi:hypothetical protein